MILMRKVSLIKPFIAFCLTFALSGCFFGDEETSSSSSGLNVAGTWRATMNVETCSPSDVCSSAGFRPGLSVKAIMNLKQNGDNVEGTYTYEDSGINADVQGRITDSQLTLNGSAQDPLGRATVALVGFVSGSVIDASVSHDVTLFDGRSGTVTGSGDFSK
jgi:hypothetical protein